MTARLGMASRCARSRLALPAMAQPKKNRRPRRLRAPPRKLPTTPTPISPMARFNAADI